jgi:hypothetical protein
MFYHSINLIFGALFGTLIFSAFIFFVYYRNYVFMIVIFNTVENHYFAGREHKISLRALGHKFARLPQYYLCVTAYL